SGTYCCCPACRECIHCSERAGGVGRVFLPCPSAVGGSVDISVIPCCKSGGGAGHSHCMKTSWRHMSGLSGPAYSCVGSVVDASIISESNANGAVHEIDMTDACRTGCS